ncbi:MAG: hypothetical protein AVDCRST_MAG70-40, partial [uncultured Thermomicrobiales bacterium]
GPVRAPLAVPSSGRERAKVGTHAGGT